MRRCICVCVRVCMHACLHVCVYVFVCVCLLRERERQADRQTEGGWGGSSHDACDAVLYLICVFFFLTGWHRDKSIDSFGRFHPEQGTIMEVNPPFPVAYYTSLSLRYYNYTHGLGLDVVP